MDLAIRGGVVVTASDSFRADIGVADGKVVQVGRVEAAVETVDATGCLVLPGGIDVHTHLDTPDFGATTADDHFSGTRAAACGGTTTIIDFARQERGESLRKALDRWHAKARGRACVDYGFHIIITDPTPEAIAELRGLPEEGVSSFKLFMAYRGSSMVDDRALIEAMAAAREADALVMVHAENGDAAEYLRERCRAAGELTPAFHATSRPPRVEAEATARAAALAEIVGAPLYVVHLTCREALDELRRARLRGVDIRAETCTHYLFATSDDLSLPDFEGAKFVFTPPPRTVADHEALWTALADGELELVSSDHAPWNFARHKTLGRDDFTRIPNGAPGVEERLAMLWRGVDEGRLTASRFVELVATSPAKIFGLYPQKGTIAPGSDADLVVWDPRVCGNLRQIDLNHASDYTLYEGVDVPGMPRDVFLRGKAVVRGRRFVGEAGMGLFIERRGPRAQMTHLRDLASGTVAAGVI